MVRGWSSHMIERSRCSTRPAVRPQMYGRSRLPRSTRSRYPLTDDGWRRDRQTVSCESGSFRAARRRPPSPGIQAGSCRSIGIRTASGSSPVLPTSQPESGISGPGVPSPSSRCKTGCAASRTAPMAAGLRLDRGLALWLQRAQCSSGTLRDVASRGLIASLEGRLIFRVHQTCRLNGGNGGNSLARLTPSSVSAIGSAISGARTARS